MATTLTLRVNGQSRTITVDDTEMPLLFALRGELGLHGPRFGCGLAQCGACTVTIGGQAVRSCTYPVSRAVGADVVTLEGLGTPDALHPLQTAFIEEQAVQCGYCINGMIMTAKALLDRTRRPTEEQIRQALAGNLCRCGTHVRIVRAVKRAADMMA